MQFLGGFNSYYKSNPENKKLHSSFVLLMVLPDGIIKLKSREEMGMFC